MDIAPLISVLIPAYNAEKSIKKCLDVIIESNSGNYEVVIADDGSEDSTYSILLEYEHNYKFIRVIKKENNGVAKTRQVLVESAHGDYIMFCDADDYMENGSIDRVEEKLLYCRKNNLDINVIILGYNLIKQNSKKNIYYRKLKPSIYNSEAISKHHILGTTDLYWSALWNKCYERSLCISPIIHFEDQIEDVLFNIDFLGRCKNVLISECIVYNYVQIGESLTRNNSVDSVEKIYSAKKANLILLSKMLSAYPYCEHLALEEYVYRSYFILRRAKKLNNQILISEIYNDIRIAKKKMGLRKITADFRYILQKYKMGAKVLINKIRIKRGDKNLERGIKIG